MSKALDHKRELANRKRKGKRKVEPLKSKTARKKGGQIYVISYGKRKFPPVKKSLPGRRGPGMSKLARDLDRQRKELSRKGDDAKLRAKLRGSPGEIVATVQKDEEIIYLVRNEDGGLDRKVRKRSYGSAA